MRKVMLLCVLLFAGVISAVSATAKGPDNSTPISVLAMAPRAARQDMAFARSAEILKSGNFVLVADYLTVTGRGNRNWSGLPVEGEAFVSVENGMVHIQTSSDGYNVSQGKLAKMDVQEKRNGNIIVQIRYYATPAKTMDFTITLRKNEAKATAKVGYLTLFGVIKSPGEAVLYPGSEIDYKRTNLYARPPGL